MKATHWLVIAALAAPTAFGQVYRERVYGGDVPLSRGELRDCISRDSVQARRQEDLRQDQAALDREAEAIRRNGEILAQDYAAIDSTNLGAVASYNTRAASQNMAVEAHNRRSAQLNMRSAELNAELSRYNADCMHSYYPSDRDAVLYERGVLR